MKIRSLTVVVCVVACLGPSHSRAEEAAKEAEEQFLSRVRQLSFEGRRAGEGYFSPDGSKMVFQSEREPGNPFFQIARNPLKSQNHQRTFDIRVNGRIIMERVEQEPEFLASLLERDLARRERIPLLSGQSRLATSCRGRNGPHRGRHQKGGYREGWPR